MRRIRRPLLNPMDCPSNEKKGNAASSVPAMGSTPKESNRREKS
jgi:hypothetical protein